MLKAQIHIQLRPSIKYGFHYANFHGTQWLTHPWTSPIPWTSPVANITSYRTKNVEGMSERSCTPLSKLWLPVKRFSFDSQPLSPLTWISSIDNFTKIGQTRGMKGYKLIFSPKSAFRMTVTEPVFTKLVLQHNLLVDRHTPHFMKLR
jgi:hypothetical protein